MRTLLISILLFAAINSTIGQTASATYHEVIEKKVTGKIGSYIAQDGRKYSIGDTLYLGSPTAGENYDFIKQNAGMTYYPLPNGKGGVVTIKKIKDFLCFFRLIVDIIINCLEIWHWTFFPRLVSIL